VNSFKILQDRSKTNIFVSNCLEGKTKKNEASFFLNKAKKNEYNRSATIEDLPLLGMCFETVRPTEAVLPARGQDLVSFSATRWHC
jgi:hypothetical protein